MGGAGEQVGRVILYPDLLLTTRDLGRRLQGGVTVRIPSRNQSFSLSHAP